MHQFLYILYVQLRVVIEDETHRFASLLAGGRAKLCWKREPGVQREVSG